MKKSDKYFTVVHRILVPKEEVASVIELLQGENVGEVFQISDNIETPTRSDMVRFARYEKKGY